MTKSLTLVGAIALGVLAGWLMQPKTEARIPPAQPPLVSLEQMGNLATVRVNYANVLEFTEKLTQDIPWTQWELRFGSAKVLLVARGDCLVGTDLKRATYLNVDEAKRSAVLQLPMPSLLSARVSHEPRDKGGSYFYSMSSTGIEQLIPGTDRQRKAIDAALAKAQEDISRSCGSQDVLATAKKNAESVLLPLLAASKWQVTLRWVP